MQTPWKASAVHSSMVTGAACAFFEYCRGLLKQNVIIYRFSASQIGGYRRDGSEESRQRNEESLGGHC